MQVTQALKRLKPFVNVFIISVIIILTYYLSLKFAFPGYFDPLIPHHLDYFAGSPDGNVVNIIDIYKSSRPVGQLILNIVAMVGLKLGIVFFITLTLINILLTILCVRAITGTISYIMTAIYSVNLFTNPYFYFNYTYDRFSTLAYFFFILLIILWYKFKSGFTIPKILLISLFIFLSFFSKENYFVAVPLFFTIQFIFEKKLRKYSSSLIIISLIFVLLSVTHSHFVNSLWVNFTASASSPYAISINPEDILSTYLYYFQGITNIYSVLVIAFVLAILIFVKKYVKEAIMLIMLGLSVYIPYSVIPNHKFIYYLFLGTPLIYAVILLLNYDVFSEFKEKALNGFKFNKKHAFSLVIILAVTLTFLKIIDKNLDQPPYNYGWFLQQESSNRNILNSFERVKQELLAQDDKNILILGMAGVPFPPFKSPDFIAGYFDIKDVNWTIDLHGDPWVTENMEIRTSNGNIYKYIISDDPDPNDYKVVIIYDKKGQIVHILHPINQALNNREPGFDFLANYKYGKINSTQKVSTPTGYGVFTMIWPNDLGPENTITIISGFSYTYDKVLIKEGDFLSFTAGIPYEISDGALAYVDVETINGERKSIFKAELLPATKAGIKWESFLIPCTDYQGQEVSITFGVESPSGNPSADWVVFDSPILGSNK